MEVGVGLRVVGAGLPRTGTRSLKAALERLLGGPCHHMAEVGRDPGHVARWHDAARTGAADWDALLAGYVAAVDYPASAFWPELAARWPDAVVLLSSRDPAAWFRSAEATVFHVFRSPREEDRAFRDMAEALFLRDLGTGFLDPERAIAAAARHDERVRATVPAGRLVEWSPTDGWEPLCRALGVPVPGEPFPRLNSTEEFRARLAERGRS